jgi:hypothetical protein
MKLVRNVRWSEFSQHYEVEWVASIEDEVLPTDFAVHLRAGHVFLRREHTREGDVYKGSTTYTEDKVSDVEQDTLSIMEAIKKEIKRARENRVKAQALTAEFTFDVE